MFSTYDLWALDRMEKETGSLDNGFPIQRNQAIKDLVNSYKRVGNEALFVAIFTIFYLPLGLYGLHNIIIDGHPIVGIIEIIAAIGFYAFGMLLDAWREKEKENE